MDIKEKIREGSKSLLNNWIGIVSISYAYATLLSLFYNLKYYNKFQIDILEYYEAYDILIGAIRQIELIFYLLLLIGLSWFLIKLLPNKDSKIGVSLIFVVVILGAPFAMIDLNVKAYSYDIVYVKEKFLSLELKNKTEYHNMKFIGSAGKFHFYYHQDSKKIFRINEGEINIIKNEEDFKINDRGWWVNYIEKKVIFDKRKLINKDSRPMVEIK